MSGHGVPPFCTGCVQHVLFVASRPKIYFCTVKYIFVQEMYFCNVKYIFVLEIYFCTGNIYFCTGNIFV